LPRLLLRIVVAEFTVHRPTTASQPKWHYFMVSAVRSSNRMLIRLRLFKDAVNPRFLDAKGVEWHHQWIKDAGGRRHGIMRHETDKCSKKKKVLFFHVFLFVTSLTTLWVAQTT
jgi:hypothetical protein